jgi:adenosylhomocysteine nucleosidase
MSAPVLVCFAVPPEAKPFRKLSRQLASVRVLVTGMGAVNAARSARGAIEEFKPALVFSSGFAGALDPALKIGDVVFEAGAPLASRLEALGARRAKFVCAERIAVTVREKSELRARTGADAVEMESAVIANVCAGFGVECVTLRAISDAAYEDLPLDFNALLNERHELSTGKLALTVLYAPHKIPALMRLGRNSNRAAQALANVLVPLLIPTQSPSPVPSPVRRN